MSTELIVQGMWEMSKALDKEEKAAHLGFMNFENILPIPAFNVYSNEKGEMVASMCEFMHMIHAMKADADLKKKVNKVLVYASFAANMVKGVDTVSGNTSQKLKPFLNRKSLIVHVIACLQRNLNWHIIPTFLMHSHVKWESCRDDAQTATFYMVKERHYFGFKPNTNRERLLEYCGPNMPPSFLDILCSKASEKYVIVPCGQCPRQRAVAISEMNGFPTTNPNLDVHYGFIESAAITDNNIGPGVQVFEATI